MSNHNFTGSDLDQITSLGFTPDDIEKQLTNFHNGFPKIQLIEPATIENGGITRLHDEQIDLFVKRYETLKEHQKILKFVPASGAASRMFKDLYTFTANYIGDLNDFGYKYPSVKEFIQHIRTFAFFNDLEICMNHAGMDFGEVMDRGDFTTVINFLLNDQYLGYGSKPKALLKFHRYGDLQRTPLEEHIVEGAEYAQNSDTSVNLHFTISPEHRAQFRKKISEIKKFYEAACNIQLNIKLSEQKHFTDIIAVDEYNNPLRDKEGRLVFRPGGHGSLIENLNEQHADIIFIKNIDNVVPDWMKHTTIVYKKALAGLLLDIQQKVFDAIRLLKAGCTKQQVCEIEKFVTDTLHMEIPSHTSPHERTTQLIALLNRPIRVCGMVKNQGEPGGGPFFVRDSHGNRSLQIVETAQINRKDATQESILNASTHFNPVDIVCATKDYRGRRFDLRQFVDPTTGFIAKKSQGATVVKSQERPGLWNGAMAYWITLFVEVPLATFNPVKTVNDLLRKEHLEA